MTHRHPTTSAIEGHVIAVAGAASGIGRAAALRLAAGGAAVVCLDRNTSGTEETVAAIVAQGGTAYAEPMEVTDAASVVSAFANTSRRGGELHALVNCVGITGVTNVKSHEVDLDDFDLVYRVNLRGAFVLSCVVLPTMLAQGYGRILHIASIAGKEGNAGMVSYSATKAGIIGMVKSQGKDYAGTGVTINALAPGVIRTPLLESMPAEQIRYMTDKIPMNRLGTLDEAAELIAWIVSPACSFTTGFTFDLSGGRAVY